MTRIVITGMGAWCSIGHNLQEFHLNLREGKSGRTPVAVTRFDTSSSIYRTQTGGTLLCESIEKIVKTDETILSDLAVEVTKEAIADSRLDLSKLRPMDIGVCLGTTVGGSYAFMKVVRGKLGLPDGDMNAILGPCTSGTIPGSVAKRFEIQGPVSTISTACASSTNSIGRAFDLIRKNKVKYMIAGGVDIFSELTFSGFNSLQLLAKDLCRPFDQARDGLMLGDAGAIVVLENVDTAMARGARIYAEIAGYSIANEAYHATGPDPEGTGALAVMGGALAQGNLTPAQVDYINAHGTGTKANDEMELKAIRRLLGTRTPEVYLSSTKSMIGHTLGAAGSIEIVATALGMYYNFIPPTINLRSPIEAYGDFRFVRDRSVDAEVDVALSNSFGFGGNVASIALRRVRCETDHKA